MPAPELNIETLVEEVLSNGEAVLRPFVSEVEASPVPPLLYHYTDDAGLLGILKSGKIWLSDVFHLNDPAELRHGSAPAVEGLRWFAEEHRDRPELGTFARDFEHFLGAGGLEASANYFVACFSETDTELGQWRAYADDGKGYAIGFDGRAFENAFARKDGEPVQGNMTFPVTYDDAKLTSLQNHYVNDILKYISLPRGRDLSGFDLNEYMKGISIAFSLNVLRTAAFFKHPAYKNEREYRYMQVQRGDRAPVGVQFRTRPYELIRYVEFDWRSIAPTALKEIVAGPAAGDSRGAQFASDCLRAHHPNHYVDVRRSAVPYRSLR